MSFLSNIGLSDPFSVQKYINFPSYQYLSVKIDSPRMKKHCFFLTEERTQACRPPNSGAKISPHRHPSLSEMLKYVELSSKNLQV